MGLQSGWRLPVMVVNLGPKASSFTGPSWSPSAGGRGAGLALLCRLTGRQASRLWGAGRAGACSRLHVPPFPLFRLNVSIECKRVSGLEPATVAWAFDLTKTNMQTM